MSTDRGQVTKGVAALYCLFGDTSHLPLSYASIYPCVERVMFFLSTKPWYGVSESAGVDPSVIQALPDPEGKIEIVQDEWTSEVQQRNISLAYAQYHGFTHGLIVDADEVYESSQLLAAIQLARSRPEVSVWHVMWFTYWKSLRYRIEPIEPYQPPILILLGAVGFVETRNALGAVHELLPPAVCVCHHLSYVLSEEALRSKHIMQPGHSQSAYPGWYEKKWKGWDVDHSVCDLHPVNPPWFKSAIPQPTEILPSVLRATL